MIFYRKSKRIWGFPKRLPQFLENGWINMFSSSSIDNNVDYKKDTVSRLARQAHCNIEVSGKS